MKQWEFDRPPKMITYILANDKAEMSLSVPEYVIEAMRPDEQNKTLATISRFLGALCGESKERFEEDLLTITAIEGMEITLQGTDEPLTIQEFCGGIMIRGSAVDVARYAKSST